MTLTEKQKAFCREYVVDLNATRAAIRAGYSQKTARQIATENLSKPAIQEAIKVLQDERAERTQVDADFVVERLRAIADQWQKNPSAATRALGLLGKHIGLWDSRQQQAAVIPIIQVTLSQPVAERLAAETRPGVQLGELAAPDVA